MVPSPTRTHPTRGLGDVPPRPRSASTNARRIAAFSILADASPKRRTASLPSFSHPDLRPRTRTAVALGSPHNHCSLPGLYRRPRDLTGSAGSREADRSRAITAGGESHPAPKKGPAVFYHGWDNACRVGRTVGRQSVNVGPAAPAGHVRGPGNLRLGVLPDPFHEPRAP